MNLLERLLESVAVGSEQRESALKAVRIGEAADEKSRQMARANSGIVDDPPPLHRGWRQRKRARKASAPPLTCERALDVWHADRRSEYGMTIIDDKHCCTIAGCVNTNSVQCINADLSLYGCVNSGKHHVCHLDCDCTQRYTSPDGGIFCTFSRRFIETFIDSTLYGVRMREVELHLSGTAAHTEGSARRVRKRRRKEVRVERQTALVVAAAAALPPPGDGDAGQPLAVTRMRFGMSIPEPERARDMTTVAEATSVSARALAGDCGGDDSHVDGFIAIDGTDEVDNTSVATRVRGLITDGTAAASAAPPDTKPAGAVKQRAGRVSGAIVQAVGGALTFVERMEMLQLRKPPRDYYSRYTRTDINNITASLFDETYRRRLHDRQAERAQAAARDAITRYYAACQSVDVRPSAHERDALYALAVQRVPQITTAVLDRALRDRYGAFLYELWRVVLATPYFRAKRNSVRLASHTLGALYMLREPFAIAAPDGTIAATVLAEPDAFLVENLPPPGLLRDWSVRVVVHSPSRVVAIKGAAGGHIEFSMTCISNGRNAIKAALLSIETNTERVAVAERLRCAYEKSTYENDSEVYYERGDCV